MSEFEVGDLGWAKMKGYPHWPAVITEPSEKVKPPKSKEPMQWVRFFGTNDHSWVAESNIWTFEEGQNKYKNKSVTGSFKKAYAEVMEYVEKHPQKERKARVPKSNGISLSGDSFVNHVSSSKSENSQKVSPKRVSKSSGSLKKKQRTSEDSSTHLTDFNRSSTSMNEKYSILLNNSSEDDLYSKNYTNMIYNYDIECGLMIPTLRLINRPVPKPPVVPYLDLHEKSKKMQKLDIQPPKDLKIGFLGLGNMGRAMVKNLLQSNHHVTIWNRSSDKCEGFEEIGAHMGQTPADVVAASDITFSCLSDPAAAKDIVLCNCGVMAAMAPGKGYIDMTSLDPETSHYISQVVNHVGGKYLEVPVLGTRNHAKNGTLVLLAAGDHILYTNAYSCFQAVCKNILYLGDVGKASKMNLIISMVMGSCFTAVSEAMNLAERSGIPLKQVVEILERRDLKCPLIVDQAKAINGDSANDVQIPLKYVQRNLYLALQLGDQCLQPLPIASATNEVFKRMKRMRYGDHDVATLSELGRDRL